MDRILKNTSVRAGLLAILTTYAVARRMFSPRVGLLAGLVLATSVEFWYIARWYRMDMPFAAAMWAAIACFWFGERTDAGTAMPRLPKVARYHHRPSGVSLRSPRTMELSGPPWI